MASGRACVPWIRLHVYAFMSLYALCVLLFGCCMCMCSAILSIIADDSSYNYSNSSNDGKREREREVWCFFFFSVIQVINHMPYTHTHIEAGAGSHTSITTGICIYSICGAVYTSRLCHCVPRDRIFTLNSQICDVLYIE